MVSMPQQVYLRDRELGTNVLISANLTGQPAQQGDSWSPKVTGGKVIFLSNARDLTAEQLTAAVLYARSIERGEIERLSVAPGAEKRAVAEFEVTPGGMQVAYLFGGGLPAIPFNVRLWDGLAGTDDLLTVNMTGQPSAGGLLGIPTFCRRSTIGLPE